MGVCVCGGGGWVCVCVCEVKGVKLKMRRKINREGDRLYKQMFVDTCTQHAGTRLCTPSQLGKCRENS